MVSWSSIVLASSLTVLSGCAARASLPTYSSVPDFTLTDQTGAAFHSGSKLNKQVWIADFIYTTCPGPCPRMSSQMHQVQTALGNSVRLVSFTVDPAYDTPPVLAEYAKHFEARPGIWYFLTGPVATLRASEPQRLHAGRRHRQSGPFDAFRFDRPRFACPRILSQLG